MAQATTTVQQTAPDELDAAIARHDSHKVLPVGVRAAAPAADSERIPGLRGVGAKEPAVVRRGRAPGVHNRGQWGELGRHEPAQQRSSRRAHGLMNRSGTVSMRGVLPGTGSPPRYGAARAVLPDGFGRSLKPSGPLAAAAQRGMKGVGVGGGAGGGGGFLPGPSSYKVPYGGDAGPGLSNTRGRRRPEQSRQAQMPRQQHSGRRRHQRRKDLKRRLRATEKALFKEAERRVDTQLEYESLQALERELRAAAR